MGRGITIMTITLMMMLVGMGASCRKEQPEKSPSPTNDGLEQRYGSTVAQASIRFKAVTPAEKTFYEGGGKMHLVDTLLPCIRVGMPQAEIEVLLGKPSETRMVGDTEHWTYTLFYSQALILLFDAHGNLTDVEGYGADKWHGEN